MPLESFNKRVVSCRRCPRLHACMEGLSPRKGLTRQDYWARPVPGFGDPGARICVVGLAPGAHGANRTGRPFTGDGAGDFMYPLLYKAGFASQPDVHDRDDGMTLDDLYITNAVKCLPPQNLPKPEEFAACRPLLEEELSLLKDLKVIIALGQGAFTSLLRMFKARGEIDRIADYPFGHGVSYILPDGVALVGCYHTSRYNVQTRRIDEGMFNSLLDQAKSLVTAENG